ncbi:NUDIX hydrolase [Bacillus sp. B-jedd]|uniref:NUDIX hydrolase n=1 Tax=Bacillus sp. B-jedd TaxID=1476857 RepID=UPI0005155F23|nr:NUDIX hydrolase [Bacillus sp. B-jedd]CEG28787.1 NUDIX hydrolase [Bacillus sp. B-jedd]
MDVVFATEKAVFNYRVAGVWIEDGHVLLHRDKNDSSWSLPGGRVEIGEEAQASIKREFLEELGIDMNVHRLVLIIENFFEYRGRDFHEMRLYFLVTPIRSSREINTTPFHGTEGDRLIYKWTPLEDLENLELYPRFLRTELQNLPNGTGHFVQRQ